MLDFSNPSNQIALVCASLLLLAVLGLIYTHISHGRRIAALSLVIRQLRDVAKDQAREAEEFSAAILQQIASLDNVNSATDERVAASDVSVALEEIVSRLRVELSDRIAVESEARVFLSQSNDELRATTKALAEALIELRDKTAKSATPAPGVLDIDDEERLMYLRGQIAWLRSEMDREPPVMSEGIGQRRSA